MFGELAYKADAGRFKFEPFANLAYVSVHTDGFTETGGAAALTSAGSTTDATFTTLGLRGSTDFALGGINATARGMLGWRHAFGDVTPTSSFAFAGGDTFTIAGVPIARDAAVIEAGLRPQNVGQCDARPVLFRPVRRRCGRQQREGQSRRQVLTAAGRWLTAEMTAPCSPPRPYSGDGTGGRDVSAVPKAAAMTAATPASCGTVRVSCRNRKPASAPSPGSRQVSVP